MLINNYYLMLESVALSVVYIFGTKICEMEIGCRKSKVIHRKAVYFLLKSVRLNDLKHIKANNANDEHNTLNTLK